MAEDSSKKSETYRIAEADSRDCEDCQGDGMVRVYAPGYDGSCALRRDNAGRPFVARTMAHCRCPLGRFIRASWPEDMVRRTPDLIDILNGHSPWLEVDPTVKPVGDPQRPVTQEDFDAFWRVIEKRPMLKDAEHVAAPKQTAWSIQTALRRRLAREIGIDEGVADVLTIEQLQDIKENFNARSEH